MLTTLQTINDWLKTIEARELRGALLTANYAIIRPVGLACPPSPASLPEVQAAMLVRQRHAVLFSDD